MAQQGIDARFAAAEGAKRLRRRTASADREHLAYLVSVLGRCGGCSVTTSDAIAWALMMTAEAVRRNGGDLL